MSPRLPITPETKVADLLSAYPELEFPLIERVPAFEKLKNPVLRRTLGRVTTLSQAARIAGVEVRDLLAFLQRVAGAEGVETDSAPEARPNPAAEAPPAARGDCAPASTAPSPDARTGGDTSRPASPPDWLDRGEITQVIDGEAMLVRGEHPLVLVRKTAEALQPGQILRLNTSFRPEPLIQTLETAGFRCWSEPQTPGSWSTFVSARA